VLCHELLTGQLPITGENTIGVLMAHIIQAPPKVSEVCPDLPPALDQPVLAMLEKKPEARPATASEALTSLSRAAERVGAAIPEGPPRLSRPVLETGAEAEPASHSADTALQSFAPDSFGFTDRGAVRDAPAPSTSSATKRSRWPLWGLLVAIGAAGTYWVSRVTNGPRAAADAAVSAAQLRPVPSAVPAKSSAPSSSASAVPGEPTPSPAMDTPAHDLPPSAQRPKKKGVGAARIPSDLESPF